MDFSVQVTPQDRSFDFSIGSSFTDFAVDVTLGGPKGDKGDKGDTGDSMYQIYVGPNEPTGNYILWIVDNATLEIEGIFETEDGAQLGLESGNTISIEITELSTTDYICSEDEVIFSLESDPDSSILIEN